MLTKGMKRVQGPEGWNGRGCVGIQKMHTVSCTNISSPKKSPQISEKEVRYSISILSNKRNIVE
jgi:hypothetical protein